MSLFDNLKTALLSGFKKAPSAAWWLLTKSPRLFRRGIQGALIYAASLMAEKVLDAAHEKLPDNDFIAKADAVAHGAVAAENFLISGATGVAKTVYDAIPTPAPAHAAPEPPPPEPQPEQDKLETFIPKINASSLNKDAESPKPEAVNQKLLPPSPYEAVKETREAAFMPVEQPAERSRANLNAALMPTAPEPAPKAPALAPDGMPTAGGLDPTTGITWGAYGKTYTGPHPANQKNIGLPFRSSPAP